MAVLFSGLQVVVAGAQLAGPFAVPGNLKQAGVGQVFRLSADATVFPLGTTTLSVGVSMDGGATFRTASMSCVGGILPKGNKWFMDYGLGKDDAPTHVQITIGAPLGFSVNVTVEAM